MDKGLKSRFSHVRELILEEQFQSKKKRKKNDRYGDVIQVERLACGQYYYVSCIERHTPFTDEDKFWKCATVSHAWSQSKL